MMIKLSNATFTYFTVMRFFWFDNFTFFAYFFRMYNAPTDLRGGIVSFQSLASLKEMKNEVNRSCSNPIQNILPPLTADSPSVFILYFNFSDKFFLFFIIFNSS